VPAAGGSKRTGSAGDLDQTRLPQRRQYLADLNARQVRVVLQDGGSPLRDAASRLDHLTQADGPARLVEPAEPVHLEDRRRTGRLPGGLAVGG
jgi:hypothetical protein